MKEIYNQAHHSVENQRPRKKMELSSSPCNSHACISGDSESRLEIKIRVLPAFHWYLNPSEWVTL